MSAQPRQTVQFSAGPPQGELAPSGGSAVREATSPGTDGSPGRKGAVFSAGPPQGELAPSGGSAVREATSPGTDGSPGRKGAVLLRVRNLHTEFATRAGVARAVDGVSFDVHVGEIVGLVGESGSGNSVTG